MGKIDGKKYWVTDLISPNLSPSVGHYINTPCIVLMCK